MHELISLVKRNILIYIRDPLAVFFSFLSTIILMVIYILFLGNIGGSELGQLLTSSEANFLIYSQMMAGVIVLNTLTIPLGNLGTIVTDFEQNKVGAFMVTPVKRYKIILGYYISSILITLVFSLIVWLLAVVIIGLVTGIFYSFSIIITIVGIIFLYVLISTSFMVLITTFITSINAFGAVSGIFGSLIGFVSGIYIPLSDSTPGFLKNIAGIVPFTHMTTFTKKILLEPSYKLVLEKSGGNQEIVEGIKNGFGAKPIPIFGHIIDPWIILMITIVLSIGLLFYAVYRLDKRLKI